MDIGKSAEAGWKALKDHWGFFVVVGFGLAVAILAYDLKNNSKATKWLAGLPLIGKAFA